MFKLEILTSNDSVTNGQFEIHIKVWKEPNSPVSLVLPMSAFTRRHIFFMAYGAT